MKITSLAFTAIVRLSAAAAMNVAYERSSGEDAFDSPASPLRLRTQPKHVSKQQPNRRIKSDEVVKQVAVATTSSTEACSCSPVQYTFVLSVDQDCGVDTIEGNVGVGSTYCFLGVTPSPAGRRRLASVSFVADVGGRELTKDELQSMRQLASTSEIISVQFIEFDTSGELIVINQDDTFSNVSLANGAVVTFTSISSDLDPTLPISDQLELVPGGIQLTVTEKVTDDVTEVTTIVDNRVAWTYTNECGVDPIEVGEGISWVTLGEHTDAAEAFCSAAVATTTTEAPPTTTEAPIDIPPIKISMSLSLPSSFGAKSGKAKSPKAYRSKEGDLKSGKSIAVNTTKAEKELPSSKSRKSSKTAYQMFLKGHKMSMPAVTVLSMGT